MAMRLIQKLIEHARLRPHETALISVQTGATWTWAQLNNASATLAYNLSRDLPPQSVVLISSHNSPEFAAAFLGVLRAGLKVFPLPPTLTEPERMQYSQACNARRTLSMESVSQLQHSPAPAGHRDIDGASLLLLSSGTTGRPRIVSRSAKSIDAVSKTMCKVVGFDHRDQVLAIVPLCHSYGLEHGLLAPIFSGAQTHISDGFDLSVIQAELRRGITILPGVPFMFESLARSPQVEKNTIRRAYSAGGILPLPVAKSFAENFGVSIGQIYGTTEVGSVTFSDPAAPWFNPASVGRPFEGAQIRIDTETTEVAIRAPSMLESYADRQSTESSVTPDGFFLTGDMGSLDPHGNLVLSGRLKLLIEIGGLKVNPLEVESVLSNHPLVEHCVVVPMRLSGTVTRLKALVMSRSGHAAPPAGELRQFVKERLASYKVPRVFEFRDQLPRSATGKILRHLIQG
jgi:acyl-CoA synthetase (AMP-forming)/AMP-acid ligase II